MRFFCSNNFVDQRPWLLPALLAGILGVGAVGCTDSGDPQRRNANRVSQAKAADELFENVVSTLDNLDKYIDLQLRPPKIILDASTSRDGRTVMAVVVDDQRGPSGVYNLLYVVTKNSRFELLDVQPGDEVRYFVSLGTEGRDAQEQEMQMRFGKKTAVQLQVLEVVDNNTLKLAQAFQNPITVPERMEVWRYETDKMKELDYRLGRYARGRGEPIGWEPTPDENVLEQIADRLNQWSREHDAPGDWQPDPLLETVPEEFAVAVAAKRLGSTRFDANDGRLLQEAVWLRDISGWARGDSLDALDQATHLFDWTVRNTQLKPNTSVRLRPWQALATGEATAEERAWIFTMLARQQRLDVIMLALPDAAAPGGWKPWLPALFTDGKLYLFDPRLGLPVPGPDGRGVATLEQARQSPAILERLNLTEQEPYPVQAGDLTKVAALIEASPFYLSRRASMVEKLTAGQGQLVLSAAPSQLADSLVEHSGIAAAGLWLIPFQTRAEQLTRQPEQRAEVALQFGVYAGRPALWKARVLHFQGRHDGEDSARTYYRQMRPSDDRIEEMGQQRLFRVAKMHASYWLGLLSFNDQQFDVAADYFRQRTLEATPDGPWTQGAQYNLARAYEAQGKTDAAIEFYCADTDSPQSHGNQLRARWLEERSDQDNAADE